MQYLEHAAEQTKDYAVVIETSCLELESFGSVIQIVLVNLD